MPIRPMKPCNFADWKERYPVLVQPKIDGVRCLCEAEFGPIITAYSASGKPLPNRNLQKAVRHMSRLMDLDGELVDTSNFQRTVSTVMSQDKPIDNLQYLIFDITQKELGDFAGRHALLERDIAETMSFKPSLRCQVVRNTSVNCREELDAMIEATSDMPPWWDGLILRDPNGPYKRGRSTGKEGYLVKYKPFKEATATVIGVEELMRNQNEPEENAFGLVKRSTAQAGKVGAEMLGAFICRMEFDGTSVEFKVGTGLTAAQRRRYWYLFLRQAPGSRTSPIGKTVRFKYLPIGSKDKPRHPVFLGFGLKEAKKCS